MPCVIQIGVSDAAIAFAWAWLATNPPVSSTPSNSPGWSVRAAHASPEPYETVDA